MSMLNRMPPGSSPGELAETAAICPLKNDAWGGLGKIGAVRYGTSIPRPRPALLGEDFSTRELVPSTRLWPHPPSRTTGLKKLNTAIRFLNRRSSDADCRDLGGTTSDTASALGDVTDEARFCRTTATCIRGVSDPFSHSSSQTPSSHQICDWSMCVDANPLDPARTLIGPSRALIASGE